MPDPLFNPYIERALSLTCLGFPNYDAYLASDFWKQIRRRLICRSCRKCGTVRHLTIHHAAYDIATMRGECENALIVACQRCHRHAERYGRRVGRTPADRLMSATTWLLNPRPIKRPRRPSPHVIRLKRIEGRQQRRHAVRRRVLQRQFAQSTPRLIKLSDEKETR